jgi:hypothetical protein
MYNQRRTEEYRTKNENFVETQVFGSNATVSIDKGRRGPFLAPLSKKPTMIRKLFLIGISCWIAGGVFIGLALAVFFIDLITSHVYIGITISTYICVISVVMAVALGVIGSYPLTICLSLVVINWVIELYRSHLQPPMP